jgi:sterol desaturase/sphingolipid hydroxylase (fatty acid hydroxylase superfamily)
VDGVETRGTGPAGFLRETVQRSIVLVVVVLPLLAVSWLANAQHPIGGGVSLGIYVVVAGLLIACEYALGFNREWGMAIRGTMTDFLYAGAATLVEKGAFVFCATVVASFGRELSTVLGVSLWPESWSFVVQLAAALLIADLGTYLRHRLFHWSSLLWRFHRIHHSMTGLYWIRSAYTHPVEQCFIMLAIMFPIALLGAGDDIIAVVAFVYALSGLLQHANVDSRSSVLNYILVTPEVHRVHHAATAQGNSSNFSAFFVFLDLLFGTYCAPARYPAPVRVGLAGVTTFPGDFLTHLAMPFKHDAGEARR